MDASQSVAKLVNLIPAELHDDLRNAFDKLIADNSESPDWHPKSNDIVLDLVHPSMYPLVYGQSRLYEAEVFGVRNAMILLEQVNLSRKVLMVNGHGEIVCILVLTFNIVSHEWNDTY